MEAIRLRKIIQKDGEILLTGLPVKKGESVEMILLVEPLTISERPKLTAHKLLHSELIWLWKDREDIRDSTAYARQLREQAQRHQR